MERFKLRVMLKNKASMRTEAVRKAEGAWQNKLLSRSSSESSPGANGTNLFQPPQPYRFSDDTSIPLQYSLIRYDLVPPPPPTADQISKHTGASNK